MLNKEERENVLDILKNYKKLSEDKVCHEQLLKDKTAILYAATLLEDSDEEITSLCLNMLKDLVENEMSHSILLETFGIFEALESISIKLRNSNKNASNLATYIVEKLRKNAPPAYGTRLRLKSARNAKKLTTICLMYIPELNEENRKSFDETLVSIKGIVSFVVDMQEKRCTVRIGPKVTTKTIASKIWFSCGLKTFVITKNVRDQTEEYIDILEETNKTLANAEYFPEADSPPKGKSITKISSIKKNASGWLKSAADAWNKSFYW